MNCLEWLPIYFGILKAGAVAVPSELPLHRPGDRVLRQAGRRGRALLRPGVHRPGGGHWRPPSSREPPALLCGRELPLLCRGLPHAPPPTAPAQPPRCSSRTRMTAAIYYSSGTTGFPKAILLRHQALLQAARMEAVHHETTPRGRIPVHPAPVPHRRQDALVRLPVHRQPGRPAQGQLPQGHLRCRLQRRLHHRLAAGALVPGHSGRPGPG